jgi:predicted amidohydrolase YtcJ
MVDDTERAELRERLGQFSADVALINANVITMNPSQPRAEAVAVKSGKIIAVGGNREIRQLCGDNTKTIDFDGKTVLPGFVESHNHVSANSHIVLQVDCTDRNNKSIKDILEKVAERAKTQEPGTWIEGYGFDNTLLEEQRWINRWELDEVAPDHPVHLWHISGHFTAVNSKALEMAGIDRDTPNPEGGEIVRDENGEATGILAEPPAQLLALRLIPPKTVAECTEGLRIVSDEYVAAGVTSTHDANLGVWGGLSELQAFELAFAENKFKPRLYAMIWTVLEDYRNNGVGIEELGFRTGAGDDRFRIGPIKIFADGSIPGLTAALSEPYLADPSKKGHLIFEQDALNELVLRYHEAGFQLAIHANGDLCIETTINAFEYALKKVPRDNHRHRIEHLPMASEEHLRRMAELGIVTTFYSAQIYGWGDRQRDQFLGPERAERLFPIQSAKKHGIVFGLHGDCPVTPISPLHCLYTAVARETSSGKILGPDQCIDVHDGLKALTIDGAYLAFEEHTKGSIEIGKLADFVSLSADPYELAATELSNLEVEMTIIDGEVVYEKPSGEHA